MSYDLRPPIVLEKLKYNRPLSKLLMAQIRVLFQLVAFLSFGPYYLILPKRQESNQLRK